MYIRAVGCMPEDYDLESCNCLKAGEVAHDMCGWDEVREMPVFVPGISMEMRHD